jgi:hypothetical protein
MIFSLYEFIATVFTFYGCGPAYQAGSQATSTMGPFL